MQKRKLDIQGIGMTSQRTRDRLVQRLRDKGIQNEQVLATIGTVPRHLFIEEALASRSYEDTALPIGYGQTISQPYMVARMTELIMELEKPAEKVLEIGTGSGYQAAILGNLVKTVYTVERIEPLFKQTRERLYELAYRNIHCFLSDGYEGLSNQAPFDAIIVTAAPEEIPDSLLQQLAQGGSLIIPVGKSGAVQELKKMTKENDDNFRTKTYESVQFVPLIRNS